MQAQSFNLPTSKPVVSGQYVYPVPRRTTASSTSTREARGAQPIRIQVKVPKAKKG